MDYNRDKIMFCGGFGILLGIVFPYVFAANFDPWYIYGHFSFGDYLEVFFREVFNLHKTYDQYTYSVYDSPAVMISIIWSFIFIAILAHVYDLFHSNKTGKT